MEGEVTERRPGTLGRCSKNHLSLHTDSQKVRPTHSFSGSLSFHRGSAISWKKSSKEMLTIGRGTKTTAERLFWFVCFFAPKSVFSTKSSGIFHLDFKGKGGCCLLPSSAPLGDLAAPQALCTTTGTPRHIYICSWGWLPCFFFWDSTQETPHLQIPRELHVESRGLFLPPSLYSILCFLLLPLAAFLLSCMGNGETSWGSPPTGWQQ